MGSALLNDGKDQVPLKGAICEFRLVKYGKHFPHVYVYNNQVCVCENVCARALRCAFCTLASLCLTLSLCLPCSLRAHVYAFWTIHTRAQHATVLSLLFVVVGTPPLACHSRYRTQDAVGKTHALYPGLLGPFKAKNELDSRTEYRSPASHVTVRDTIGNNETLLLRSVQANDTGKWDGDMAVTDFAMLDPNRTLYHYAVR
jgi:hypothetical protein